MPNEKEKLQDVIAAALGRRVKKYAWPGSVIISGLLLYAARDGMPPGTDLVGALLALLGLGRQMGSDIVDQISAKQAQLTSQVSDLVEVADDHATHLERHQSYLKPLGCPPGKVLRPTAI